MATAAPPAPPQVVAKGGSSDGGEPSSSEDQEVKARCFVKSKPRTIDSNDVDQQVAAMHLGVAFEIGSPPDGRNPHRFAELERFVARTRMAHYACQVINDRQRGTDLGILFPSLTEVKTYEKLLRRDGGKDKNDRLLTVPIDVYGYRRLSLGSDNARERSIFPNDLSDTSCFIGSDCLYYFSPEEWVELLVDENATFPATIFLSGRYFSEAPGSVHFDRYRWKARPTFTTSHYVDKFEEVNATNKVGKDFIVRKDKNGDAVKKVVKTRELVTTDLVNLPEIDFIEGRGYVDDAGILHYYASGSSGDSNYHHLLKGNFLFRTNTLFVTHNGVVYQLACHSEWTGINYHVVRLVIAIWREPEANVTYVRPCPSFVQAGRLPQLTEQFVEEAATRDPAFPGAVDSYISACKRLMKSYLGLTNYKNLEPLYQEKLRLAVVATARYAWRASGLPIDLVCQRIAGPEISRGVREAVAVDNGVPPELAADYVRLTEPATRAQWLLYCIRAVGNLGALAWDRLKWIWRWVRGDGIPVVAAILPAILAATVMTGNVVASRLGRALQAAGWFRRFIVSTTNWASRYPTVAGHLEDALYALQILAEAFTEEYIKKGSFAQLFGLVGGPFWGIVFGIYEQALWVLQDHRSGVDVMDWSYAKEAFLSAVRRAFIHFFFALFPLIPATLIHAGWNWLQLQMARKYNPTDAMLDHYLARQWRILGAAFSRAAATYTEAPTRDIAGVELATVAVTVPENLVHQSELWYKEGGEYHPISEDPHLMNLVSAPMFSPKPILVDCEATKLLVKPSCSFLDLVQVERQRLAAPLPNDPNPDFWAQVIPMMTELLYDPMIEFKGHLIIWSPMKLHAYIEGRPWPLARKRETQEYIRQWGNKEHLEAGMVLMGKGDEIIPNQPKIAVTGNVASKTRPLRPRAGADVPAMALAVPLKHYLGGTHWFDLDSMDYYTFHPRLAVRIASMTYLHNPRADLLSNWCEDMSKVDGWHIIVHGDDMFTLWVDGQDVRGAALDLTTCDKSCRTEFQLSFCHMLNHLSDFTNVQEVQDQFDRLVGWQRLQVNVPGYPSFYWFKEGVSTATGEPLTSVKAVFGHFVCFVASCRILSKLELTPETIASTMDNCYQLMGLIPEWESDESRSIWFHPSACTFLGGMFVHDEKWKWVSNKVIKAGFIFPDVVKIYGHDNPLAQHMMVLQRDTELSANPVGRALIGLFQRYINRELSGSQASLLRESAYAKYMKHLATADRYKAEQLTTDTDFAAPVVTQAAYLSAARHMLGRVDRNLSVHSLELIIATLKSSSPDFPIRVVGSEALYALRFGLPKQPVEPELSLLCSWIPLFYLGRKNLPFSSSTVLNHAFFEMSTKSAKKSTKASSSSASAKAKAPKAKAKAVSANPKVVKTVEKPQQARAKAPPTKATVRVRSLNTPTPNKLKEHGDNVLDMAGGHSEHGQVRKDAYDVGWSSRKGGLNYQLTHTEEANLAYLHALHNPEDFDAQVGLPAVLGSPQGKSTLVHYQLSGSFESGVDGTAFCIFHPPLNFGFDIAANGTSSQAGGPIPGAAPGYAAGQSANKVPHCNFIDQYSPTPTIPNPQPAIITHSTAAFPGGVCPSPASTPNVGVASVLLPSPDVNLHIFSSATLVSAVLRVAPIESALLAQGRLLIGRGATLLHSVPGSFVNQPTYEGVFADQSNELRTASVPNWDPKTMARCTYTPRAQGAFVPVGTYGSDVGINAAGVLTLPITSIVGYPGMMAIAEVAGSATPTGSTLFAYEVYCTYELHACATSLATEKVRASPTARPEVHSMPPMIMRDVDIPTSAGNLAISQIAEDKPPGFVDAVKKGIVSLPEQIKWGIDTANKVAEGVETAWDVIEDIGLAIGGIFGLSHFQEPRQMHPINKNRLKMTTPLPGTVWETRSVGELLGIRDEPTGDWERKDKCEERQELDLVGGVDYHVVVQGTSTPNVHRGPRKVCPKCNPPPLTATPPE